LNKNTTGSNNIAVGNNAMFNNTTGSNQIAIGVGALQTSTGLQANTAIGNSAGSAATTAGLTSVGFQASQYTVGGSGQALGTNALRGSITGLANVGVGAAAGSAIGSGTDNLYVGQGAGQFPGTGLLTLGAITGGSGYTDGVYVGVPVIVTGLTGVNGRVNSNTTLDITVSGGTVTAATINSAGTGWVAGDVITINTSFAPAGLLTGSGFSVPVATVTTSQGNTGIGRGALQSNGRGTANTALGYRAGFNSGNGGRNTYLGYQAGENNTGDDNVIIGYQAGQSSAGNNNLIISNTNTATPLIKGIFDGTGGYAGSLTINGVLILYSYPPATATSPGTAGTITWDSDWIYICTATNTWKRVGISTW